MRLQNTSISLQQRGLCGHALPHDTDNIDRSPVLTWQTCRRIVMVLPVKQEVSAISDIHAEVKSSSE
jgi:hypothetical protein